MAPSTTLDESTGKAFTAAIRLAETGDVTAALDRLGQARDHAIVELTASGADLVARRFLEHKMHILALGRDLPAFGDALIEISRSGLFSTARLEELMGAAGGVLKHWSAQTIGPATGE